MVLYSVGFVFYHGSFWGWHGMKNPRFVDHVPNGFPHGFSTSTSTFSPRSIRIARVTSWKTPAKNGGFSWSEVPSHGLKKIEVILIHTNVLSSIILCMC